MASLFEHFKTPTHHTLFYSTVIVKYLEELVADEPGYDGNCPNWPCLCSKKHVLFLSLLAGR